MKVILFPEDDNIVERPRAVLSNVARQGGGAIPVTRLPKSRVPAAAVSYEEEVYPHSTFPGFGFSTRSKDAKLDIVAYKNGQIVALMSTRWRFRHDRVDLVEEVNAALTATVHFAPQLLWNGLREKWDCEAEGTSADALADRLSSLASCAVDPLRERYVRLSQGSYSNRRLILLIGRLVVPLILRHKIGRSLLRQILPAGLRDPYLSRVSPQPF